MAFHAIVAGEGEQYVAVGIEAASRYPAQEPFMPHPSLDGRPGAIADVYLSMGETAKNVAERYGVSREAQDAWAARSQQRAVAARESGHFAPDMSGAVPRRHGRGRRRRAAAGHDRRAARRAGAAMRGRRARPKPRARMIASAVAACGRSSWYRPYPRDPRAAAACAYDRRRDHIVEFNVAFAAQVIPCRDELGLADEQLTRSAAPSRWAIPSVRPEPHPHDAAERPRRARLPLRDRSTCVAGGMGQRCSSSGPRLGAHRGIPSSRSAMMLRWISLVPE